MAPSNNQLSLTQVRADAAERVAAAFGRTFKAARMSGNSPPVSLVMLSGGLDSVALLHHLLAETDHVVHAHHIALDNWEARSGAEHEAMERVLVHFDAHYRPFERSRSAHGFHFAKTVGGRDTSLVMFTASRVVNALRGRPHLVFTGHFDPGPGRSGQLAEGEAILNAALLTKRVHPHWLRPFERLPGTRDERKADIWLSTPRVLADLCWWCRRPVSRDGGYEECGTCGACRLMRQAYGVIKARRSADGAT